MKSRFRSTAGSTPSRLHAGSIGGSVRRDPSPDGTGDPHTAEAAVTHGIFGEVLLMIVLGEVEFRGVEDLGRDRPVAFGLNRHFEGGLGCLGGFALLGRV